LARLRLELPDCFETKVNRVIFRSEAKLLQLSTLVGSFFKTDNWFYPDGSNIEPRPGSDEVKVQSTETHFYFSFEILMNI
jgi:hypothetical protein